MSCLILTERYGPLEDEATAYAERSHLLPLIGHSSAPLSRNIVSPVKTISFCISFRTKSQHRAILESRGYATFSFSGCDKYIEGIYIVLRPTPKPKPLEILMQTTSVVCSFCNVVPRVANN